MSTALQCSSHTVHPAGLLCRAGGIGYDAGAVPLALWPGMSSALQLPDACLLLRPPGDDVRLALPACAACPAAAGQDS